MEVQAKSKFDVGSIVYGTYLGVYYHKYRIVCVRYVYRECKEDDGSVSKKGYFEYLAHRITGLGFEMNHLYSLSEDSITEKPTQELNPLEY